MSEAKHKLSGPIVSANIKRIVGILAQDAGMSVENFLGKIVTEAIQPKWDEFQARIAQEWKDGSE